MMRSLVSLLFLASLSSFGQGNVRHGEVLHDLLTINPYLEATKGKLSYEITRPDANSYWGASRFVYWVSTTNFAPNGVNVVNSPFGGQWIFGDKDSPIQDARWWGASSNKWSITYDGNLWLGSTNVAAKLASIEASIPAVPNKTYVNINGSYYTSLFLYDTNAFYWHDMGDAQTVILEPVLSNWATNHVHDASVITSGTVSQPRLGSGAYDTNTFLRGDGTWAILYTNGSSPSLPTNILYVTGNYVTNITTSGTVGWTIIGQQASPNIPSGTTLTNITVSGNLLTGSTNVATKLASLDSGKSDTSHTHTSFGSLTLSGDLSLGTTNVAGKLSSLDSSKSSTSHTHTGFTNLTLDGVVTIGSTNVVGKLSSLDSGKSPTNHYHAGPNSSIYLSSGTSDSYGVGSLGIGPTTVLPHGNFSVVIGTANVAADGAYSVVLGNGGSTANGDYSISIGNASHANFTGSTAIGNGASATTPYEIRIGTPINTTSIPGTLQVGSTNVGLELSVKSPLSHNHDGTNIASGYVPVTRLGSGLANSNSFLRGDGVWAIVTTNGSVPSLATNAVLVNGNYVTNLSNGPNVSWSISGSQASPYFPPGSTVTNLTISGYTTLGGSVTAANLGADAFPGPSYKILVRDESTYQLTQADPEFIKSYISAGNVYAESNNVFTASNRFQGPVTMTGGVKVPSGTFTANTANITNLVLQEYPNTPTIPDTFLLMVNGDPTSGPLLVESTSLTNLFALIPASGNVYTSSNNVLTASNVITGSLHLPDRYSNDTTVRIGMGATDDAATRAASIPDPNTAYWNAASTAIGYIATTQRKGTAVGARTWAEYYSTAIGYASKAGAPGVSGDTAIGAFTEATGGGSVAIGGGATAHGNFSAAIFGIALGGNAVSIGGGTASGSYAMAIGGGNATEDYSMSLGSAAIAGHANSIAVGSGATTTATHQVMLGTSSETVVVPAGMTLGGVTRTTWPSGGGGGGRTVYRPPGDYDAVPGDSVIIANFASTSTVTLPMGHVLGDGDIVTVIRYGGTGNLIINVNGSDSGEHNTAGYMDTFMYLDSEDTYILLYHQDGT